VARARWVGAVKGGVGVGGVGAGLVGQGFAWRTRGNDGERSVGAGLVAEGLLERYAWRKNGEGVWVWVWWPGVCVEKGSPGEGTVKGVWRGGLEA
jgi:hypothetical protein